MPPEPFKLKHELNHLSVLGNALSTNQDVRLKRCKDGWMMFNIHDMYVGRSLDTYGEFSEFEAELFRQLIKDGDVVLDIGANIGAHTVGMSEMVGATGHVMAFEPQRYLYQMLCGNLAINGCRNVYPVLAALGGHGGYADVPIPNYQVEGNFGCIEVGGTMKADMTETVPLYTVDELELPKCAFLKIDVEGMELEVLKGAEGTISRLAPIIYAENDRRDKTAILNRWMLDQGYRCYWHLPPLFNKENYFRTQRDVFPDLLSANILCFPQGDERFELEGFEEITEANAHVHPLGS